MKSVLMACALVLSGGDGVAETEWWEGSIELRGAPLAIRLALEQGPEPSAEIDIPQLVMAWEPVEVVQGVGAIEVEFPFGIGPFTFDPNLSRIEQDGALGDETLTLRLERVPAPGYRKRDVTFDRGGVTLSATLVHPEGRGPFPAILLVHGSGETTRSSWSYRSWADYFVRQGMAVLLFDQRGTGNSGGSWQESTFADLAEDVLAGVEFLRRQEGVDPRRIGLKGSSQGGWIAPLASALSEDIAFLILTSAPAVTPADQEMQQTVETMKRDGRPAHEVNDALAYLRLYFSVAHAGGPWRPLNRAIRQAQASEWGGYVDQPRSLEDLAWWKRNLDFDPAEILGQLRGPILALYGEKDVVVPPVKNAPILAHLIRSGGNNDLTLRTFPGADHRLEVPPGVDEEGRWRWFRIADGVLEEIRAWLEPRVLSASAAHSRSGD